MIQLCRNQEKDQNQSYIKMKPPAEAEGLTLHREFKIF